MRVAASVVFLLLLTVWAGIIIGVSLIATPIKFQAPSLSMPVGLEIGRYTFRFLERIELCFLVAAIVAAGFARPHGIAWVVLALIVAGIVVQRYWLLPVLDGSVSRILAGGAPSFSIHHRIFAVIEAAKAALLITAAAVEYRSHLG